MAIDIKLLRNILGAPSIPVSFDTAFQQPLISFNLVPSVFTYSRSYNSLDFVFIDASHIYKYVAEDIDLWEPKVKKGGLVSGHDLDFPDVKKAVAERNIMFNKGPDNVWWWIK